MSIHIRDHVGGHLFLTKENINVQIDDERKSKLVHRTVLKWDVNTFRILLPIQVPCV